MGIAKTNLVGMCFFSLFTNIVIIITMTARHRDLWYTWGAGNEIMSSVMGAVREHISIQWTSVM